MFQVLPACCIVENNHHSVCSDLVDKALLDSVPGIKTTVNQFLLKLILNFDARKAGIGVCDNEILNPLFHQSRLALCFSHLLMFLSNIYCSTLNPDQIVSKGASGFILFASMIKSSL